MGTLSPLLARRWLHSREGGPGLVEEGKKMNRRAEEELERKRHGETVFRDQRMEPMS